MSPEQIAFDPGIGFGKTVGHNLTLIKRMAELRVEERPLVLGASRKRLPGRGHRRRRKCGSGWGRRWR